MIGNDIVDLKQESIQLYWKRGRYLDKVFTEAEQEFIALSENHHHMFWLLWSMKETAYKCHVQYHGTRFFNPKKLKCNYEISSGLGLITIDEYCYHTITKHTDNYVYTEVSSNIDDIKSAIYKSEKPIYETQSRSLKLSLLQSISKQKQIPIQQLHIKTSNIGIPQVFRRVDKLPICLSLTHCGRFSAYTFKDITQ